MRVEDVETVARMDALDHDPNPEKGYEEARQHTLDHLEIVPQHRYVVEDGNEDAIAAMVLHPREDVFEIEDFHVKEIDHNREALATQSETRGIRRERADGSPMLPLRRKKAC
jgi:hypothetical protein